MKPEELNKLVDKTKYQVFVLQSPASFPAVFSVHPWLVINKKGEVSRYEIRHHLSSNGTHLHINAQPLFQGLPLLGPIQKFFQRAELLKMTEGDENSEAKRLIDIIENSKENYPHLRKYAFLGANCATYVAWVLKDFPEMNIKLPWNAVGKDFDVNKTT